jgi:glycosyltransferase involved in cell wall biosynthesis
MSGQVIIVDSGSTDRTFEVAEAFGCEIYVHPFETHARQWAWALESVSFENEWVLALDADYRLTPGFKSMLPGLLDARFDGYYIRRRMIFFGRELRFGGVFPSYQLRFFRRSSASIDVNDLVDPHFAVNGPTKRLRDGVIEDNVKDRDLSVWLTKQLDFVERQAREEVAKRSRGFSIRSVLHLRDHNARVASLKMIWGYLPLYWRSVGYFLYRYLLRLGFLDGRAGFLYHVTQALIYRVALDVQVERLRKERT